jgi:hypothetical protein
MLWSCRLLVTLILHEKAVRISNNAVISPVGNAADPSKFFGEDPDIYAARPENRAKAEEAIFLDEIALMMKRFGWIILLFATASVLIAIARWGRYAPVLDPQPVDAPPQTEGKP